MSSDKEQGLIPGGKYIVYKRNPDPNSGHMGQLVEEPCFVMKFDDPIARVAIEHYAYMARDAGYVKLCDDLLEGLRAHRTDEEVAEELRRVMTAGPGEMFP